MIQKVRKYQRRCEELQQKRYDARCGIGPFAACPGQLGVDEVYRGQLPVFPENSLFDVGDEIEGRDRYLWLERELEIPVSPEGWETVLLFDFGKTGGSNQGRFEGMVYADGQLLQGVDENHGEILLGDLEGKTVRLTFLIWSGMEGQEGDFRMRLQQADLARLHKDTDQLYFFFRAIWQTADLLPETDTDRIALMDLADRVLLALDWDGPAFYESAGRAVQILEEGLEAIQKPKDITVHAVGHTHIDVAWLWRLKHTREKAQRSFATALRLMDRYEDYQFLQSQPQLYSYVKEDCPELYKKISQRVEQGRWEPEGGMWLEADCNLPSGESLVRQFLHGIRFFQKEFGKKCRYLWLPDVFGYSWALPQIMKLCGIDTFMTTKISWNETNQIPEDLFRWKGLDGSEILTYFIETPEEWRPESDWFSTYNGLLTPATVLGSWKKFKNRELSRDVMISYGYGDGGGGPTREMLELRRVMDRMPGLPGVKTGSAGEFFDKIHASAEAQPGKVPVWDGELYLEFHRGTYTTQAYNKKMNRKMEGLLAQTEWLTCLGGEAMGENVWKELSDCWEATLLHQFHDIIPGSSIREVYEDSRKAYARMERQALAVREQAMEALTRPAVDSYVLASFDSFAREEIVYLPQKETGAFYQKGQRLDAQKTEGGYYVKAAVESFSLETVTFRGEDAGASASPFSIDLEKREAVTPVYELTWNAGGQLTRIFDRVHQRNVLKDGALGNVLELYEDKPLSDDAWNVDSFYTEKMCILNASPEVTLEEAGELLARLRFTYRFGDSSVEQDMILYRDSLRIDFDTRVHWEESHKLLKTAFYTDIRSVKASYDIQFGHAERPTHANTSWERAKFEVCAQKWADLSEHGYGVSLLNDSKYGYSIRENAMKLSLLRSPAHPDPAADRGDHHFVYALLPHTCDVTEGETIREAAKLNLPALAVKDRETAAKTALFTFDGDGVMVDAVKKAEDDDALIIRMHEYWGGRGRASFGFDREVDAHPVNLLEEEMDGVSCEKQDGGRGVRTCLRPFEIRTLKVRAAGTGNESSGQQ